jgi:very-short-patch-repair endonuclease
MKSGIAHDYVITSMTPDVLARKRATMLDKHGVSTPFSLPATQEKIRQTNQKRYGSNSSMGDPIVRAKKEATFIERYGTRVPIVECQLIISKSIGTQIEKYGDIYQRTQAYRDAYQATSTRNWGTKHPMHSARVKSRIDFKAAWLKQHATKKANRTYASSKSEHQFAIELERAFGIIERQVVVNGRSIDFYVPKIDVYVQFDGVYWHGLDRDLEVIKTSKNTRDTRILESYASDREQDDWFSQQGLRLIRITDAEFKQDPDSCISKIELGTTK